MSSRSLLLLLLVALLPASVACRATAPAPVHGGLPVFAESGWNHLALDDDEEEGVIEEILEDDEEGPGVLHHILLYIPNRIFDVFELVRTRVRLGPGIAVGVRATEVASIYVGSYASIFVGLHGPRGEPSIPWPVGVETLTGAKVSLAEGTVGGDAAPTYGAVEFGAGFQLLLVGVDIGVDPLEILDLVTGFFFIDLVGDDY